MPKVPHKPVNAANRPVRKKSGVARSIEALLSSPTTKKLGHVFAVACVAFVGYKMNSPLHYLEPAEDRLKEASCPRTTHLPFPIVFIVREARPHT